MLSVLRIAAVLLVGNTHAQGFIENPMQGSTQSGVGVFSGWHCTAREIRIQIDGHMPLIAGSGTERLDTRSVCGHAATGFSLLFNWNLLSRDHPHTVTAFADGQQFASAIFSVANFGVEFLKGQTGRYTLRNFPDLGSVAELQWDEEKQGFSIVVATSGLRALGATYFGAVRLGVSSTFCSPVPPDGHPYETRHASFVLDFKQEGVSILDVLYADGKSCRLSERASSARSRSPDGFLRLVFDQSNACPEIAGGLGVAVDGQRIEGVSHDTCGSAHIIGTRDNL